MSGGAWAFVAQASLSKAARSGRPRTTTKLVTAATPSGGVEVVDRRKLLKGVASLPMAVGLAAASDVDYAAAGGPLPPALNPWIEPNAIFGRVVAGGLPLRGQINVTEVLLSPAVGARIRANVTDFDPTYYQAIAYQTNDNLFRVCCQTSEFGLTFVNLDLTDPKNPTFTNEGFPAPANAGEPNPAIHPRLLYTEEEARRIYLHSSLETHPSNSFRPR